MRYAKGHKDVTRRRIVETAARLLRKNGFSNVGLDEVMRTSGLTHGGFYAHFRSKTELIAEVCENQFEIPREWIDRIAKRPGVSERVQALVCGYLTTRHRDEVANGCFIAALGGDAVRVLPAVRKAFSVACQRHRRRMAEALRLADDPQANTERVTSLLGFLVGTLVLARSVEDAAESEAILAAGRRTALDTFSSKNPSPV